MIIEIESAAAAGIDIFLGPEYFFTHNTASLLAANKCISYTDDEAWEVRNLPSGASGRAPRMLIIPGTFFMVQGVYRPHIFNTAFVYLGGSKYKECSKHDSAADATYAARCGLPFFQGESGVSFEFGGLRCYLQSGEGPIFDETITWGE